MKLKLAKPNYQCKFNPGNCVLVNCSCHDIKLDTFTELFFQLLINNGRTVISLDSSHTFLKIILF